MNMSVCDVVRERRCGFYFTWLRETLYVRRLYQSEWFRERHELHKACVCLLDVLLSICIGAVFYVILVAIGYPSVWLIESHLDPVAFTAWVFSMGPLFGAVALLLLTLCALLTYLLYGYYNSTDHTIPDCLTGVDVTRHESSSTADDCVDVPLLTADADATFESPLHLSQ